MYECAARNCPESSKTAARVEPQAGQGNPTVACKKQIEPVSKYTPAIKSNAKGATSAIIKILLRFNFVTCSALVVKVAKFFMHGEEHNQPFAGYAENNQVDYDADNNKNRSAENHKYARAYLI